MKWPLLIGIFLLSAAILHLEILQTRIFSVLLWHHVTYLVVTFTLLGFAASGALLSLFPGLLDRSPAVFLATCSLLFAITTHGAFQYLGRSQLDTLELLQDRAQYLTVFVYYLYLVVPFLFGGLAVVGALRVAGARTGLVYGFNLAGSAAGCLLFARTLVPLGGEGSVFLAAALAALAALSFSWQARPGAIRAAFGFLTLLVAAASALLVARAEDLLPFRAAGSKVMVYTMNSARRAGLDPSVLYTRWDPLCRLDVVDLGRPDERMIFQDADAPTSVFAADHRFDPTSIYSLPYRVASPGPDVLVIGVGGGQDLRQAVWNGASRVTGVEINRTTAGLMRNELASYSGNVYEMPGVQVIENEGRSYVRRSDERYDLIQMTGTDTYAALSSGSYVLSESYLYTVDAYDDFFAHLEEDGLVSVLRFRFDPPRESLRLVAIAVESLRRRGLDHPERCVMVVDSVLEYPDPKDPTRRIKLRYAALLFRTSPFRPEQIQAVQDFCSRVPGVYSVAYAPGLEKAEPNEFDRYLAAVAEGTDEEFIADYPYRILPVTDDSPFFFNFHRWESVLREEKSQQAYFTAIGGDPIGLFLLLTALLESTVLVALLVILPLLFRRKIRMPRQGRGSVLLYFLGLGIGFLFLEIACMQRMILYLGHPTRSITVVLFSFLLFSGLGSLVAGALRWRSLPRLSLCAIVFLVAGYALFLPALLQRTLGLETGQRIAVATALLAVPSFFMGMPFPSALSRLRGASAPFLPWAFAINGGASVVASVAAIFVAMAFGFSAVFWLAAGAYLLAIVSEPGIPDEGVPAGPGAA